MKLGNLFNNTSAWQHPDPKRRMHAITQLADLTLLQQICQEESDKAVRKHAHSHYQALMLSTADNSPALAARLTVFQHDNDKTLIEHIARHSTETALRRAAIAKLDRPALLADLILQETNAPLQQDMLAQLNDAKSLEKLSNASRTHNKTLHRQAENKLEALKIAAGDPATITQKRQEICTAIEQLTTNTAALTDLQPLQTAWEQLPGTADAPLQTHFERACRVFQRLHQAQDELRNPPTPAEPETPAAPVENTAPAPSNPKVIQLCQRAKNLLDTTTALKPKTLSKLQQDWAALQPQIATDDTTAQQLRTHLGQLEQRLHTEAQTLKDQQKALKNQLQAIQTQIDEGHIQAAREALIELDKTLKTHPTSLTQPLHTLLNQIRQQTQDLADWQHWGNNQERLKLCEQIEALIGSEEAPPALAKQIKTLQQRWKTLETSEKIDDSKRHASERLWQRFQRANNKAYEPCRLYFTEQANARTANLHAAEQVCTNLETAHADKTSDWKAVNKQLHQAQQLLRGMHTIPRQAQNTLRQRLTAAIAPLQENLTDEHARVARRKQHLLEQAEKLHQQLANPEQLASTISSIQNLQKQWKDSGSADRKTEQALWQQFRGYCDAIFAARNDQRNTENTQKKVHFSHLETLCQQAEALAKNTELSVQDYRSQQQKISTQWDETNQQQRAPEKLHKRFQRALKHCQQQLATQEKTIAQQGQQQLREKAYYCAEWEARETANTEELHQAKQTWDTLPTVDPTVEQCLQTRFDTALAELSGECVVNHAARSSNLKTLNTLCIQLELAMGVDSPAEAQAERMKLQVARLSQAMQGGGSQQSTKALEREIYLLGPISHQQWPNIAKRLTHCIG